MKEGKMFINFLPSFILTILHSFTHSFLHSYILIIFAKKMLFHTEYHPHNIPELLSISRPSILLGSCFTDNILRKMSFSLWRAYNPAGALYNPLSIAKALQLLFFAPIEEFKSTIFKAPDGCFHSSMFDSSLYGMDEKALIDAFVKRKVNTFQLLDERCNLIVTFGSAFCYYPVDNGEPDYNCPVGNCHKLPSYNFKIKLVEYGKVVEVWKSLIDLIHKVWPDMKIIFTISPIRYMKYGFVDNSLSKSVLRLCVHELQSSFPSVVSYFPAYEIMNDDLRDYRFYADDMIHPSSMAIDYIWDKFISTYLTEIEIEMLKKGASVSKALSHRPILPESMDARMLRLGKIRQRWLALKNDWNSAVNPFASEDVHDDTVAMS